METARVHDEDKDMRTIDFPSLVPHFSGKKVVEVLSGGYHCLAVCLSESGSNELYAWGSGDQGQLGMGNTMFAVLEPGVVPLPLSGDDALASVAAGVWCTFIVSREGEVYVCGANFSGVLGLPQVSEGVSVATFSRVRFPSYDQVSIKSISCGLFHSCALAHDGRVFSWGGGTMGQLGHGDRTSLTEPKRISSLEKELVLEVFAADTHSLFVVDRNGEGKDILTCGYGRDGQLGQKKNDVFAPKPRRVPGIEEFNIRCVAVGGEHNAFVTEEGKVYTWGRNTRGQLGHGKRRSTNIITHVNHLRKPARSVSAGYQHTMVIMESGQLAVFGHGRFGQLGHGELEDETKPRYCIDISETCLQATGGREHSLCLLADGTVLNWGSSHSIYGHRTFEKANEIKEDFVDTLAGMLLEEIDEDEAGDSPTL